MRTMFSVQPKCSHRYVSLKESPFSACGNAPARDQKINRANLYENGIVLNISRWKLFRSISYICVQKQTHQAFRRTHRTPEISELSLPEQCSRNSIPPVCYNQGLFQRLLVKVIANIPLKQAQKCPFKDAILTETMTSETNPGIWDVLSVRSRKRKRKKISGILHLCSQMWPVVSACLHLTFHHESKRERESGEFIRRMS